MSLNTAPERVPKGGPGPSDVARGGRRAGAEHFQPTEQKAAFRRIKCSVSHAPRQDSPCKMKHHAFIPGAPLEQSDPRSAQGRDAISLPEWVQDTAPESISGGALECSRNECPPADLNTPPEWTPKEGPRADRYRLLCASSRCEPFPTRRAESRFPPRLTQCFACASAGCT